MTEILKLINISKYYGTFAANQDICMTVKKGTVHAVVGENGAGKSTLMNLIAGVSQPSGGEICLNGKRVRFRDANDANRAGIGMVWQEFMLFDKLSVLDNIMIGYEDIKQSFFINKKESAKKIKQICDEYGFHFELNALVRDLPIAVLQQVEIVKVLFRRADIIILDEPTAVLPYQEIQGLFKAIRHLVSQGKTILFITHKLKEVLEISDTVTVMKNGRISGEISGREASEASLTNMMVGRQVVLALDKKINPGSKTVLEISHLAVKDERGIPRVKDLCLELKEGEILGIVGVSGNGQNELVEAVTGLRTYEAGEIRLHGKTLAPGSARENRLRHMGYVPQDRGNVGSSLTSNLVENCMMGYHLSHLKKHGCLMDYHEAEVFSNHMIETYNVKTQSNRAAAGSLSGGNLQKLIVGREFSQGNQVLIIEDPTRGIDIGSIEFIWKEIQKQVERERVSVLLITYDLAEAMTLSDRILVMYDGRIHKELMGANYDEKEIGIYMMGGGEREA